MSRNFIQSSKSTVSINNFTVIKREIDHWFITNPNTDIEYNNFTKNVTERYGNNTERYGNTLTIVLNYYNKSKNDRHVVDIKIPMNYPNNKNGFACIERIIPGIEQFKFLKTLNKKMVGKRLSLNKILSTIINALHNYKKRNS